MQETYHDLMRKVLDVFRPGKFLMTIFANKVSSAVVHAVNDLTAESLKTEDLCTLTLFSVPVLVSGLHV